LFVGIAASIYLFNGFNKNSNEVVNQKESDAIIVQAIDKHSKETTNNNLKFVSNTNFSGSSRIFATCLDYLLLFPLFSYLFDFLTRYAVDMAAVAISFSIVFILLYSFLQYKSWVSINFLLKKKIVHNDGSKLNYKDFIERTIKKTFVMVAYSFFITFFLFPPVQYFDEGLTPVDKLCNTKEAK
jgi:hypothetical protein